MTEQRGQASVELLALLPLVLAIALLAFTVLAARTADEQAGEAAEAAALALLQGGQDPHDAATAALPRAVRSRATISITGTQVHVRVRPRVFPPIPGLPNRLAGEATATTGAP